MDTIKHYSGFPATGVSLRQMVQFGESPSTGKIILGVPPCGGHLLLCHLLISVASRDTLPRIAVPL